MRSAASKVEGVLRRGGWSSQDVRRRSSALRHRDRHRRSHVQPARDHRRAEPATAHRSRRDPVGATIHPTARPSRCAPRARSDVRVRCLNRLGRRGSPQPASKDPWRARPTPSSPSTATCSTTRRRSRDGRGHAPRPGNRHRRVQPLRGRPPDAALRAGATIGAFFR